jgi:AraC family transcriptional regulator of adaptative response / DNA-3-methyladenine glycosylase II
MRLIADGVVDRDGVEGLARRLGYSVRQLERHLLSEVGAGPLALARAQRAQTARLLIETTTLSFAEVAFGAGFSSIRQFNDIVRSVFELSPRELRRRANSARGPVAPGGLSLRLPFRAPFWPDNLFGHLVATSVPGCEELRRGAYRRTLRLPNGNGIVTLTPRPEHVACQLRLDDLRDVPTAIARCRRLLDLDADPEAVTDLLASDPYLESAINKAPGRRVPRTVDEAEFALRAVIGQQVSTAAARTHTATLLRRYGTPIIDPDGGLTHVFPPPEVLAGMDPSTIGLPHTRRRCLVNLIAALADGTIDLGAGSDWGRARHQLADIDGIGAWTVETIAMRALGDPDAFPATDMGVRRAAAQLGLGASPAAVLAHAERWRPWRAYSVQYLWSTQHHPINDWKPEEET